MPNWCSNKLTIEHEDQAKVEEFVKAYKQGKACEHYLPLPESVAEAGAEEWRSLHWGTKWDIGSDRQESCGLNPTVVGNQASMSFDSAWSPPLGLYNKLHQSGFKVEATYAETVMGFFGLYIDGNDYYGSLSHKELIPQRIKEDFPWLFGK